MGCCSWICAGKMLFWVEVGHLMHCGCQIEGGSRWAMAPSRTLDEVRRWVVVADGGAGMECACCDRDLGVIQIGWLLGAGSMEEGVGVADDGRREASLVGLLAGVSDGCRRRGRQMGWLSLLVGENGLAGACGRTVGCCSRRRSSPSFVDEEGRSWICNRDVVAVLSNGSDHPIGASPVVGCVGSRRGRWRFGDLDQLHVVVILGSLDLPCMSSPELTGCRPSMKAMEH
ncbi:hypothetical protein ACLOJK_020301 [Asimina triloba]